MAEALPELEFADFNQEVTRHPSAYQPQQPCTHRSIKASRQSPLPLQKSPLRYPGGKNRAVQQILSLLPHNLKRVCAPFLGGASIELACASLGIEVFGYDKFTPLVNFWQRLIKSPTQLTKQVQKYYPLAKEHFYKLQKDYSYRTDPIERAAIFFVLNRSSFSGTTFSGGMSPNHPRFTQTSIDRLARFNIKNFCVAQDDFTISIPNHEKDFLYLDPPYANDQKLYGDRGDTHKGFNHKLLHELLDSRGNWLLSYNDCEMIRSMYRNYRILERAWTYGMNSTKRSNELLIASNDLKV